MTQPENLADAEAKAFPSQMVRQTRYQLVFSVAQPSIDAKPNRSLRTDLVPTSRHGGRNPAGTARPGLLNAGAFQIVYRWIDSYQPTTRIRSGQLDDFHLPVEGRTGVHVIS
jgi:hypothetical protein